MKQLLWKCAVVVCGVASVGGTCQRNTTTNTTTMATVRTLDMNLVEKDELTEISVIHEGNLCRFRLEYMDPMDPDWGIYQIAGTPPLEEKVGPCTMIPSFVETRALNPLQFDQQTAYFWLKEAREYAKASFWLSSTTGPLANLKPAKTRIDTTISTAGQLAVSCAPLHAAVTDGCMRVWHAEGPRLFLENGMLTPELIVHEYGHYAAGYVFGYMDTAGLNGFDATQCGHRAFQEALADMFKDLVFHKRGPLSIDPAEDKVWNAACPPPASGIGVGDDHIMGLPLSQAFRQALAGKSFDGTITVPWLSAASANSVMAEALAHALAMNQGHDLAAVAHGMLRRLEAQDMAISEEIRKIFKLHGLGLDFGDRCPADIPVSSANSACMACISETDCHAGRCDQTLPDKRCIPPNGTGAGGKYCTHDSHCMSGSCNVGVACN